MGEILRIIEVPSCRPYASTDIVVIKTVRLDRAIRNLTHLERYKRREQHRVGPRLKGSIVDFQTPTGRAQIGQQRRTGG